MDDETTPSRGFYAARGAGAGGKLKKPPSRKPPTTPYSRPPPNPAERGKRRWLSSVVDPAYRLISGGATRLFTSFFSPANTVNALPAPNHDEQEAEIEQNATGDEHNDDSNNWVTRTETAGPSRPGNSSNDSSGFQGHTLDDNSNLSDVSGLSQIEQLLKGKKFSRDEVNRLMDIIQSKAVEHPIVGHEKEKKGITTGGEAKGPVNAHAVPKASSGEIQEDMSKTIWGTSTSLSQSARREEVGASPIEIAKAYMGSRTSDIDDRAAMHSNDIASTPFIPAPSPKPSTCWPGSMVQNQRDYSTPQSERGRFGLHNFPRTPYSRTIFSKSKSKFTPLQGGDDKSQRTSSTPFKHLQTPVYGQTFGKPRDDALDGGYGSSVGPIRRTRHKVATQTPPRGSPYVHSSSIGTPQVENSHILKEFLPAGRKNFELGGLSGNSPFQSIDRKPSSSQVGVHPQSSQIARTILEHINRNSPTPKDKSEELKLAIAWKKPLTSDIPSLNQNGDDNSLLGGSSSRKVIINDNQKKPALENAEKWNSLFKVPPPKPSVKAADVVSNGPAGGGSGGRSLAKNTEEAFPQTTLNVVGSEVLNQQKKPLFQPSGTKRVFPAISVDKPESTWKFSSDKSSTFTFPVSTSSAVFSEPPTPSVMPSVSTSTEHQLKDGDAAVPTYSFGSKKSDRLVFTFPSTSDAIQIGNSDIKFSFGSDKPRLSFKDAVCH
ncbi:nuclear pore complex protein NUP1 isoform X1 [Rosa rugosa]|uniref:nuclear pore complex protein NUP1 isoform X1 n=1 Tax=Rosa rugosa TaxID=74645 RepID=UPI002B414F22|nr:nuclear pore complex protein NUP1 isoform X1 [Rosa rugosa]